MFHKSYSCAYNELLPRLNKIVREVIETAQFIGADSIFFGNAENCFSLTHHMKSFFARELLRRIRLDLLRCLSGICRSFHLLLHASGQHLEAVHRRLKL